MPLMNQTTCWPYQIRGESRDFGSYRSKDTLHATMPWTAFGGVLVCNNAQYGLEILTGSLGEYVFFQESPVLCLIEVALVSTVLDAVTGLKLGQCLAR